MSELSTVPKVFQTAEPWLPLDRRWGAVVTVGPGKTVGAYGATRAEAVANLEAKLGALGPQGA